MSMSLDIHDVEHAIKRGHKITPAQAKDALKAFRRILARLDMAEQHEDRLIDACDGFDKFMGALKPNSEHPLAGVRDGLNALFVALNPDNKWRAKPKGKR